ncbi:MAG: Trk system potassium transporter TrkA [Actinomycetota bacterium]|nr:Trk system potassium transporter TrkA [Actinomycetota bacterium]
MRVVIVGAGHDGSYLAERLVAEGQEVVIIEADEEKATRIQERLDVLAVHGNGASPAVLRRAGVDEAELFLAVTDRDGANVLACRSAKALGVPRTVARVEDPDLREVAPGLGVDVVVDARDSAARQAARLAEYAGVTEYAVFADGRLSLVAGVVTADARAVGRTVAEVRRKTVGWAFIVAAVVRGEDTVIGRGETVIEVGDRVVFMVETDRVRDAIGVFGIDTEPVERVIILGGTLIAVKTAEILMESGHEVLIVERDRERAASLARRSDASILQADPTEPKFLRSLGLGPGDVVVGLSGHDELNLMGCLVAGAVGAPKTIARFGHRSVAGLLRNVGIGATLSSRVAVANRILQFVRRDRILSVVTVKDTDAEALEMELGPESPALGKTLAELGMSQGAVIGGIVRGVGVRVPTGDTRLQAGDRVVVFAKSEAIDAVERLLLA